MKLIVGLGNPGLRYRNTKHNAGFWVIEKVAEQLDVSLRKRKFNTVWGQGRFRGRNFIAAKPLTFMNLSGGAVKAFVDYFKLSPSNILIVFDDVYLKVGTIRLRAAGTAGGHNGMRSVIDNLQTDNIPRLRIGVSSGVGNRHLSKYVLSAFKRKKDIALMDEAVETARDAVLCWLDKGIAAAMNTYNKKGRTISDHE